MVNINKKLIKEIELYCKTNDIENVEVFCNQLLEKAFTAEKYGDTPDFTLKTKKIEKKSENLVEDVLPLPQEQKIDVVEEPKAEAEPPKKTFKKANINDDYRVYDNF